VGFAATDLMDDFLGLINVQPFSSAAGGIALFTVEETESLEAVFESALSPFDVTDAVDASVGGILALGGPCVGSFVVSASATRADSSVRMALMGRAHTSNCGCSGRRIE
jgi:hypothetical protein